MTISRRDTILISVLVNVGLLAVLLIAAIDTERDPKSDFIETRGDLVAIGEAPIPITLPEISTEPGPTADVPTDEIDKVLQAFENKPIDVETKKVEEETIAASTPPQPSSQSKTATITVKKGDSLDKIAKANKTTVQALRTLNSLKTDVLKVGQTLKVPASSPLHGTLSTAKTDDKQLVAQNKNTDKTGDIVWVEIKSGDSPWKIAKQYNVNYEDILKLNNLDEKKARSLKIGDKIRIK